MDRFDVIVAGGGSIGLAMALVLSRAFGGDLRVAIVDAAPLDGTAAPTADVRASALGAASRRLLEAIGVWSDLAAEAQHIETVEITDSRLSDGIRPVLLSYDTRLDGGEPAMTIVPNAVLTAMLRRATAAAAGVTIFGGVRIVETARERSGATVTLADGRDLAAPLIVAADGRASAQREAAGIKAVAWAHAQTGIVTVVDHELPHRAAAVQHFLPGGPFAILPLPGNRSCVTWSEDAAPAAELVASDDATFLAALDERAGGKLGAILSCGPRQTWPLDTFLARSLIADRLALIGDATRGVHPIAGQGLNLGLRDVAALADVVADNARLGQDIGSVAVLARYEQWRRADGVMSAASFDGLNRLFSNDVAVVRALRDAGLGLVDRSPAIKRRLIAEAAGLTGDLPRLLRGVSA